MTTKCVDELIRLKIVIWTYFAGLLKGSFTHRSNFALSLQAYKTNTKFLLSKMH
jgi:hypothetical protein